MTDRQKLTRLLQQPRWKIALFVLALNALLLWQTAIDYYFYLNFNFLFASRAFAKRTVQRAHWVGAQIAKPHRLASFALVGILCAGMVIAPSVKTVLYWSMAWGSALSLFVIYRSFSLIFSRSYNQPYQRPQN